METKTLILIGLIAAILIVAGVYLGVGKATVSQQGYASEEVMPDNVAVYFNVQVIDDSAEVAKNKMSEIVLNLEDSLTDVVDEDEIQTSGLNVYPNYDWNDGNQKITGYTASQQITVKTDKIDKTGKIVDKGVDAGALVNWINFELSDAKESEVKARVLEIAAKDAKTKAEALARGSGKRLGGLVSISSQDFNYYPYRYFEAAGDMAASNVKAQVAVVNINPQKLEVSANVQAVYRIW